MGVLILTRGGLIDCQGPLEVRILGWMWNTWIL